MAATAEVVRAARDMFAHGYTVVPVREGTKQPAVEKGENWRRPWREAEVLVALSDNADHAHRGTAIGFPGGALNGGIVPLDFDSEAAEAWWRAGCEAAGLDPDDFPTVRTPGKLVDGARKPGLHRYVHDTRGTLSNRVGKLKELKLDIRGAGHVMLPPSAHPDGGFYRWGEGRSLYDFDHVPPCPDFVYEAVARAPAEEYGAAGTANTANRNGTSDVRIHAWCRSALDGERGRLLGTGRGGRNETLNIAALKLGALAHYGAFTRSEAHSALEAACLANGYIRDKGQGAFEATFASGWTAGEASPKTVTLEDRPRDHGGNGEALRQEAPPAGAVPPDLGIWDAGEDDYVIPPREWLLGTAFCRTFVSTLIADGAVGKTTVRVAQHLALASGRPITGEHVFLRCRTLLLCFEDDRNELRRRVLAAMRHHAVAPSDLRGWLFLGAIRQSDMKLALLDDYGRAIKGPLEQALADFVRERGIDLVTLDPFVKIHALEENSNPHMDFVTGMLAELATMLNIATDLTHHTSKGPADAGNADRGRGASSAKNAGRLVKTLAGMTTEEAQAFDVTDIDRRSLVRMDNGKVNLAPPANDAQWLRLVSVNLGNGTETYPNGDEVQAVEVWDPPGKTAGLSHYVLNAILDRIEAGLENGERYSAASAADARAVWPVFAELAPTCADKQVRRIVKDWLTSGTLYYRLYKSPKFRKDRQGLFVNYAKRPS